MRIEDVPKYKEIKERVNDFFTNKEYENGLIPDKNELLFESGLKEYGIAMVEWASNYKINRGGGNIIEVPVIFIQSMKQYAEKLTPLRNGKTDIPLVAVSLTGISPDYTRYRPHTHKCIGYIYRCGISSDGKETYMKNADIPITLGFKVTLFGKLYDDMFQYNYRLLKQFHHGGHSYIVVNNGLCRLELKGVNDESALEGGQTNDRILRWSYSIDCKAWLKEPIHTVKTTLDIPVTMVNNDNKFIEHYNNDLISKVVKHE